jgi:hypothetical protein
VSDWRTLGIERTDDIAAIRRAYARKLKATDVDADPAAFIALRAALERALAGVAWGHDHAAHALPELVVAHDDWPAVQILAAPGPAPADAEDRSGRFNALERLLFPVDGAAPDPDALTAAFSALIDHPEMEQVDRRAEVENMLAGLLFDSIPRSAPILPLAVAHFGWEAERDHVHGQPFYALLAERADDLACLERLRRPEHRWHAAFVRLTEPAAGTIGLKDRLLHLAPVSNLLQGLRRHYPNVELELDREQVALWDKEIGNKAAALAERADGISWYGWLVLGSLGLTLGQLAFAAAS